jgi:hypothetical protein
MNTDIDELVHLYLKHWASRREEDYEAWEKVNDLVARDPAAAWPLVLGLIAAAPSDEALSYVAAGFLEECLIEHGAAWLPQVKAAASDSSQFRKALRGVWGRKRMATEVRDAVEAIARNQ